MQLNKEILAEITRQIHSKSFHKSALYRTLRDELTAADHWKAKRRGIPGYNKGDAFVDELGNVVFYNTRRRKVV